MQITLVSDHGQNYHIAVPYRQKRSLQAEHAQCGPYRVSYGSFAVQHSPSPLYPALGTADAEISFLSAENRELSTILTFQAWSRLDRCTTICLRLFRLSYFPLLLFRLSCFCLCSFRLSFYIFFFIYARFTFAFFFFAYACFAFALSVHACFTDVRFAYTFSHGLVSPMCVYACMCVCVCV